MFEFGALTLGLMAVGGVLSAGLLTGDDVTIGSFHVPPAMEWEGWTNGVIEHRLHDQLSEIIETAASEIAALDIKPTSLDRSVTAVQRYLQLDPVVDAARLMFGLMPYYITGEATRQGGQIVLNVRIYEALDNTTVHVIRESGTPEEMDSMLHAAALRILSVVDPYVLGLYWRRIEEQQGDLGFPRTFATADQIVRVRPLAQHHFAYALRARTFMRRAELDASAPFEAREADYREAIRWFDAALLRLPEFAYAHVNLGVIHAVLGEFEQADEHFAAAVALNPNDLHTRIRWAESLELKGAHQDAVYQYTAAVMLAPDDATLRDRLGEIYMNLGEIQAAMQQYQVAISLDPGNEAYRDVRETLTGTEE